MSDSGSILLYDVVLNDHLVCSGFFNNDDEQLGFANTIKLRTIMPLNKISFNTFQLYIYYLLSPCILTRCDQEYFCSMTSLP